MNDTLPPPPPQAKPFAPEKLSGGGGCQKPLLVGCGLLSLLLGIAAVVFVVKAKDILAYAMNQLRAQVVSHLPEDAGDADRQRIEAGFDQALARIRNGELDPAAVQALQKHLTVAASAAGTRRLTREEVAGLIAALDKFNQVGAEAPAEEPADESEAPPATGAGEGVDTSGAAAGPARPPAP